MQRSSILTAAILVLVAIVAVMLFTRSQPEQALPPVPAELSNILLPEPRSIEAFQLTDTRGQSLESSHLRGNWTLLFFGYTHCPDICPTTLSTLSRMAKELQQTPETYRDTRFVFVSVDPGRDSLEHMKQYVSYFHPDFLGATGDKSQIDALARQLGAVYMFDGDLSRDDYIVNHSASIAVIDPHGRWVARFNPPHKASEMAKNFRRLRDYFQAD